MSLITTVQAREHIETDLSDAALQRLIDDAEADIVDRFGAHYDAETPLEITCMGGGRMIRFNRPVSDISGVIETVSGVETELSANDYELWYGGRILKRRATGDNPSYYWQGTVTIEYKPVDDTARRIRVLIDLVRLACRYQAVQNEKVGDYSVSNLDYDQERIKLLNSLSNSSGIVIA